MIVPSYNCDIFNAARLYIGTRSSIESRVSTFCRGIPDTELLDLTQLEKLSDSGLYLETRTKIYLLNCRFLVMETQLL